MKKVSAPWPFAPALCPHYILVPNIKLQCFPLPEMIWTASSEFGTYRLCEQRRFRRACASAQSRQNLRCSLIQAVNQEEPSDRKTDPWPLWMAGHAQLKFVMTKCSKTQIRLTGLISNARVGGQTYSVAQIRWVGINLIVHLPTVTKQFVIFKRSGQNN